jgi:nucleoside-diphosphate-sugar epimerase
VPRRPRIYSETVGDDAPDDVLAGSRLHAVGDEGVPFREIAEAIGRHLDVPAVSIPPEEAADYFGFLAPYVALDNPTSSEMIRELLGWRPTNPGLIDDLGRAPRGP